MMEHRGERAREENCRLLEVLPVYIHIYEGRRVVYFLSEGRGGRDIPQGQGTLCSYANFLFPLPPCNAAFQSRG